MHDEAHKAAEQDAHVNALALAAEEAREAQRREGHEVVEQQTLPAPGDGAVDEHLQQAEEEALQQSPAHAPAQGKDEDRYHREVHGAAVGQRKELERVEHQRQRQQHRALSHGTKFPVSHFPFSFRLLPAQKKTHRGKPDA